MPATVKDAASVRRKLLAAQLLSDQGISEVAITVPEGKLAAPSLYWYERDPELFQAELEAMNHFFSQFRPDRLIDNRMSCLGSLASGIPSSQRIGHLQLVYDNDHPHAEYYGGSITVFSIEPNLSDLCEQLGEPIPHTLRHESSGELSICTVAADAFRHGRDHSSTGASALAWASKWIAAFELWMLGDLSTEQFAGHSIGGFMTLDKPCVPIEVIFSRRSHAAICAETMEHHTPSKQVEFSWAIFTSTAGK